MSDTEHTQDPTPAQVVGLDEIETRLAADLAARAADTDATRAEMRAKDAPSETSKRIAVLKRETADELSVHFLTSTQRKRLEQIAMPLRVARHNEKLTSERDAMTQKLKAKRRALNALDHEYEAKKISLRAAIDDLEYKLDSLPHEYEAKKIRLEEVCGDIAASLSVLNSEELWSVGECMTCAAPYIRKSSGNRRCPSCAGRKE